MKLFLFIALLLIPVISIKAADDGKMNACFITINSSQEKEEFTKALNSGPNKGKFNIVEFIKEEHDPNWFQKACESNIRCDILLISGHFGGKFFGRSRKTLDIEQLETNSCNNSCDNLLSAPKEVFLMGCNTLAGKESDNRSASEYLQVLLDDDIELSQAQQIVEQRYGAIGTSFSSTMKRSFKNVPHIYGFHSIGPSGANVQFLLKNYLKQKRNYHQHLMKIEMQRTLALEGKFNEWNKRNKQLATSLKSTNFTQTSGLLVGICEGDDSLDPSNPNYELMKNICMLVNKETKDEDKAQLISQLLQRDDFETYIKHVSDLVDKNYNLRNLVSKSLEGKNKIKGKLLELLETVKTGVSKVAMAKFQTNLNLLSEDKFKVILSNVVKSYLKYPVSIGAKDTLCSLTSSSEFEIKITLDDIDRRILKSKTGLYALTCISNYDDKLVKHLFRKLQLEKSSDKKESIYTIISKSKTKDKRILKSLHKQAKGKDFLNRVLAQRTLYTLGKATEREIKTMLKYASEDERTITVNGEELGMGIVFQDVYEDYYVDGAMEEGPP